MRTFIKNKEDLCDFLTVTNMIALILLSYRVFCIEQLKLDVLHVVYGICFIYCLLLFAKTQYFDYGKHIGKRGIGLYVIGFLLIMFGGSNTFHDRWSTNMLMNILNYGSLAIGFPLTGYLQYRAESKLSNERTQ